MFQGKEMISNKKVILRLSRYRNALIRFKAIGFVKIFSEYLAEALGVTSAQVRKDFSVFGISGNKRGEIQKVVLVGAGQLGSALLKYRSFEQEGIKIITAFDSDPAKQLQKSRIPILPVEQMEKFIADNKVKIAIICVPDIAAQQTLDALVAAGIRGILNFAPIDLKAPADCIVSNVNLAVELENLIYFVKVSNSDKNNFH
jgi:redox-sensing transcriptional repressor